MLTARYNFSNVVLFVFSIYITPDKLLQTWDLYLPQCCYTQKLGAVPNHTKCWFVHNVALSFCKPQVTSYTHATYHIHTCRRLDVYVACLLPGLGRGCQTGDHISKSAFQHLKEWNHWIFFDEGPQHRNICQQTQTDFFEYTSGSFADMFVAKTSGKKTYSKNCSKPFLSLNLAKA